MEQCTEVFRGEGCTIVTMSTLATRETKRKSNNINTNFTRTGVWELVAVAGC